MNEIKMLTLSVLEPDPKQPRKYFNEVALQELAANIAANGILQPILVTPAQEKGMYSIVCGERRYRAAHLAQLTEIPAMIAELTAAQVLQAQISENLLRQDVNPMEEAIAFKSLMDEHNLPIEEIAAKVAKDIRFVKQRLKLNDLRQFWQDLLLANRLLIKDAVRIAILSAENQKLLFDAVKPKENDEVLDLHSWELNNQRKALEDASFDINDAQLYILSGACTSCQFNSANTLFSDEKPTCGKPLCFATKQNLQYNKIVEEAATTTGTIFASTDEKSKEAIAFTEKTGITPFTKWFWEYEPEAPKRTDYEGNNDTIEEDEKDYQDDVAMYNENLKEWEENIATGKIVKAFFVDGNEKGKYRWIELDEPTASNSGDSEPATTDGPSIKDQINEARAKIDRHTQIAENKIWEKVFPAIKVEQNIDVIKNTNIIGNELLYDMVAASIHKTIDWRFKNLFCNTFDYDATTKELRKENLSNKTLMQMLQFFVLCVLPPYPSQVTQGNTYETNLCLQFLEQHHGNALTEACHDINVDLVKKVSKLQAVIESLESKQPKKKSNDKSTKKLSEAPAE